MFKLDGLWGHPWLDRVLVHFNVVVVDTRACFYLFGVGG